MSLGSKGDGELLTEADKQSLSIAGEHIQFHYNREYQSPLALTEAGAYDLNTTV